MMLSRSFRQDCLEALNQAVRALRPPPKLTVSEWADQFRQLSSEASAEPGRWITARNEPARAVMDSISDPAVERVVIMSGAQLGKSEFLLNVIGYLIDLDPGPVLMVQPTLEMAEAFSKDRVAPMLRDTKALQGKVKDARARDSNNTLLHKQFPGGHLTLAGANSPASLASRPIRVVLADEVDRYPASAGTEGDPVNLARKRTATFWNRKIVMTSTPTLKGFSRIEAAFEGSDQRRLHVTCEDCGEHQHMIWGAKDGGAGDRGIGVWWPKGKPEEAGYKCKGCGSVWDDAQRWRQIAAVTADDWVPGAPFRGTAGFHWSQLYSPWAKLADLAQEFLECKGDPSKIQTWVNTVLGETWDVGKTAAKPGDLRARAEHYGSGFEGDGDMAAPAEVLVATVGVDVQGDRLEVERVGWGRDEESWSLDHLVLRGDPTKPEIWRELDEYLLTPSWSEDGRRLRVRAACIDSGFCTEQVYRFCEQRYARRVFAVKGLPGDGVPIWPRKTLKAKDSTVKLFGIGTHAAKDVVLGRLKIAEPGPGYCHFPQGRPEEWFKQLTAEKVVTKYVKGHARREFHKRDQDRNEALDLRVYAYAALLSLNIRSWQHSAAQAKRQAGQQRPESEQAQEQLPLPEPEAIEAKQRQAPRSSRSAPRRGRGRGSGRGGGSSWTRF